MREPNVFLIGAPKCGTTSLSVWLQKHPRAFISRIKEPRYFATDLPGWRQVQSRAAYRALFEDAGSEHVAVGEASTIYLSSSEALPNIHRYAPAARLVVTVRNPIDLVPAWHAELRYRGEEDEPDFARAWRLQADRQAGRRLPRRCRVPAILQYAWIGRLGAQLERARAIFPLEQMHVIVFDDLVAAPATVWVALQRFLGLPLDDRRDFPSLNVRQENRIELLALLLRKPPDWLARWRARATALAGTQGLGIGERMLAWQTRSIARPSLPPALRAELAEVFADDVAQLGGLLKRDLAPWLNPAPGSAG